MFKIIFVKVRVEGEENVVPNHVVSLSSRVIDKFAKMLDKYRYNIINHSRLSPIGFKHLLIHLFSISYKQSIVAPN